VSDAPLLECRTVGKRFGSTQALRGASLALERGEIRGFIGENGAGKSTLTKILCGVHAPDEGIISMDGTPVSFDSPDDAIRAGIVTVHQDVNLIETMTVAENVFLNCERSHPAWRILERRKMADEVATLLADLEIPAGADDVVGDLPTDLKKMVQLVRAFRLQPRVLLLDEPTSALTHAQAEIVVDRIRRIAASGVAVLYISHYLSEVLELSNTLTILRDGAVVWSGLRRETDIDQAITHMIGRRLEATPAPVFPPTRNDPPVMEITGWSVADRVADVSIAVHAGEVLGIGGLAGAGLTDLGRSLFGDAEFASSAGTMKLDGRDITFESPADAIENGIALVTGDRLRSGALLEFSLADNLALPSLRQFTDARGFVRQTELEHTTDRYVSELGIRAEGVHAPLSSLSGGNQQKVMLAKWLATNPKVLIVDEPTIGVDVGSKEQIRTVIRSALEKGVAVIMLTTELDEVERMAHRAIVMFRGAVAGRFDQPGFTKADLLRMAAGATRNEHAT
jgi:ABC-type sugar transport system ATPase subunit